MTSVNFLMKIITRLSAVAPISSPWETCALNLIEKYNPSSVFFSCKSYQHCPDNDLYKTLQVPSRSIFGLDTNELPLFRETHMVFLVDDKIKMWNNRTILKYRLKGWTDFKIVIVANMSDKIEKDFQSMKDLFSALWQSGIVRCAVLLMNDTTSQMYTFLPFKGSHACEDTSPVLLGECAKAVDNVFDLTYKIFNLNQCTLRVAVIDDRPFLRYPMRGRLSYLMKEIALKMNTSFEPVEPESGTWGGACGPEEYTGSRGLVMKGTAHLAVGSFNQHDCSTLEQVNAAYTQCMAWCTPVLSAKDYVVSYMAQQFQTEIWVALIFSVFLVSVCVVLFSAVSVEHWKCRDALNLALIFCVESPSVKPKSTAVRIVVAVWLLAYLVVRTAYEGELKSRSAAQLGSHIIYDLDELEANADIKLCTSRSSLQSLKSVETPSARKIFFKTKPCNGSFYENIVAAATLKDRAVFTGDVRCSVTAHDLQRTGLLYPKTGGCLKTIPMTTILTLPGSPFKQRWRSIQDWSMQSGLMLKWLNIQPLRWDMERVHVYSMNHLLPVLFILGVGCFISWLVFLCEIIWASIASTKT